MTHKTEGFDGIDPDNMDGWDNRNGLKLTPRHAIDYMHFLAHEAHARGLAIGLKNASHVLPDVLHCVQFAVSEQAVQFDDVDAFAPLLAAGKPVFHVEYPKGEDAESARQNDAREVTGKKRDRCFAARDKGFSSIIKNVRLDQWVQTG